MHSALPPRWRQCSRPRLNRTGFVPDAARPSQPAQSRDSLTRLVLVIWPEMHAGAGARGRRCAARLFVRRCDLATPVLSATPQPRIGAIHGHLGRTTSSYPKKSVASAVSAHPYQIPDLTEIQTRSYERFLQYDDNPLESGKDQGIEGVLREIFPIESYDKTLRLEYVRYELGKPRYEPDECRQLRLTYGRPFQRLAAADQRAADRGRSLPGRHADHARRRRVHHQRRRARRGQPVAPQPGRRLRQRNGSRRPPHAQLPHHSRARQLDRAEHHQEGHAQRPHRPERQVLGHDAAAGHGSRSTA